MTKTTSQSMDPSNLLTIKTSKTSIKSVKNCLASLLPRSKSQTSMRLQSKEGITWMRTLGWRKNFLILSNGTSRPTGGMLLKTTLRTIIPHNTTCKPLSQVGTRLREDLNKLFQPCELQTFKSFRTSSSGRSINLSLINSRKSTGGLIPKCIQVGMERQELILSWSYPVKKALTRRSVVKVACGGKVCTLLRMQITA